MISRGERRRAPLPAALILGISAGFVAAIGMMPTGVILSYQINKAENAFALRECALVANIVARQLETTGVPPSEDSIKASINYLAIYSKNASSAYFQLGEPPLGVQDTPNCGPDQLPSVIEDTNLTQWASACIQTNEFSVITAKELEQSGLQSIVTLFGTLVMITAIITSLGVLRLLAPISRVSEALRQVARGQRNVRLQPGGLAELNELISNVNLATDAVSDREDAILSRIKVVQDIARVVAHEVRNPLQTIELQLALLGKTEKHEEKTIISESIRDEIRIIDRVIQRLLRNAMKSGKIHLNMDKAPVLQLAEESIQRLQLDFNRAKINARLTQKSNRSIYVDRMLASRCISNLLVNAIKAMGGKEGKIEVRLVDKANATEIQVHDSGPGVSPELAAGLFTPSSHSRGPIKGVGLAFVEWVASAHQGYVYYQTSPLGGALFAIGLPIKDLSLEEKHES